MFLFDFFVLVFQITAYQSSLIPRKPSCPKIYHVMRLNVATLKDNMIIIYSKDLSTHIWACFFTIFVSDGKFDNSMDVRKRTAATNLTFITQVLGPAK